MVERQADSICTPCGRLAPLPTRNAFRLVTESCGQCWGAIMAPVTKMGQNGRYHWQCAGHEGSFYLRFLSAHAVPDPSDIAPPTRPSCALSQWPRSPRQPPDATWGLSQIRHFCRSAGRAGLCPAGMNAFLAASFSAGTLASWAAHASEQRVRCGVLLLQPQTGAAKTTIYGVGTPVECPLGITRAASWLRLWATRTRRIRLPSIQAR